MAAVAYYILTRALLATHDRHSPLAKAIGSDFKGRISVVIYLAGIGLAFLVPGLGLSLYVLVAVLWLVPDRRIERTLAD
jgi:uncharacterized membrane protein